MSPAGLAAMRVLNNKASIHDIKLVACAALCWETERWTAIEMERKYVQQGRRLTIGQWREMRRSQLYSR